MKQQTEIGKALSIGVTLAGAAAAGNSEARTLIALLAEAEKESARLAKRAQIETEGSYADTNERQLSTMADDFERAVAESISALRAEAEAARVHDPWPDRRQPPGSPAHRRHRRWA